mmetsp:Transcript_61324/g.72832  ORF Transcript_61324/g.72832 Transcript_61324/m.72832 type:complete len:232 (+) Transcript_61324:1028-1723(+)
MYRLVSQPFLARGDTVAVVGYRTYPTTDATGQVEDLESAMELLHRERSDLTSKEVIVMGHSSGAHIGLLWLVERMKREREGGTDVLAFVGLSGPYDISHHFDYEANRGVEEISPMKAACGYTRANFRRNSPHLYFQTLLTSRSNECDIVSLLPRRMLLVHGMEDDVVPFTTTCDTARLLRGCGCSVEEMYLARRKHEDTVMEFMLGGFGCEGVLNWLDGGKGAELLGGSRL